MDRRPTFLEFFAGGGMARAGLGEGWRCLFANDFDEAKARVYQDNWGDAEMVVGDVGQLAARQLPTADLAWASFPCQDLSLAGAGAGLAGERSGTFMDFWGLMRDLRDESRAPQLIVLENVCGLLTSHGGEDFAEIVHLLGMIGYQTSALVMDAADFLPQSRPRLFIVAARDDMGLCAIAAAKPDEHWHPLRLQAARDRLPHQWRARWPWLSPARPTRRNVSLADLIEDAPEGVAWHDEITTDRLLAMMSPLNRAKVDAVAASGRRTVGTIYRRTRPADGGKAQRAEARFDDIAGCLRTPAGGSSRQTIIVVEGGRVRTRLISARETARLMGLPDSYRLPDRYNDAYHLTGDGVVVPVVRWLAGQILEPLLRVATRHYAVAAE